MCFTVLPQRPVQQLLAAANTVQKLMDDGTMTAAFIDAFSKPEQTNTVSAAFDRLQECTKALASEQKHVSPFLRYRREILAETLAGQRLRMLVLNLYSEAQIVSLRRIFECCGDHEIRVALECIVYFSANGDRDSQFMTLAMEIAESFNHQAVEVVG